MGIPPYTPFDANVSIINDVRSKEVDCIVAIGGGSIIAVAKAIVLVGNPFQRCETQSW